MNRKGNPVVNFLEGKTLGDRIKALRSAKGLSQGGLSDLSGVSQQVISVIETRGGGTHPTKLAMLAQALGCEVEELMTERQLRRAARSSTIQQSKRVSSFDELMINLQDELELKIGFRPTNYQALKYLIKKADPDNELGLMEPVDENRPRPTGA
jgi:transcriptional regulator with XRE-family HTH domain